MSERPLSGCPCRSAYEHLEPRLRSSRLRAMATGVIVGQRQVSLNEATVLFAVAARASRRSADEVARSIIRDRGIVE